jgi:hypothetical protein
MNAGREFNTNESEIRKIGCTFVTSISPFSIHGQQIHGLDDVEVKCIMSFRPLSETGSTVTQKGKVIVHFNKSI